MNLDQYKSQGLSQSDIDALKKQAISNEIKSSWKDSYIGIIFINVFNILNIVVFLAGLVVWYFLGFFSFFLLVGVLLINLVISLSQEFFARYKLQKLQTKLEDKYEVIRSNEVIELASKDLLPGDIFILKTGQLVPADCICLNQDNSFINNSALTGESDAIEIEEGSEVLAGGFSVSGEAILKIQKVGDQTKQASVVQAGSALKRIQTPVQKILTRQINYLMLGIALLTSVVFFQYLNGYFDEDTFALYIGILAGCVPATLITISTVNHSLAALKLQRQSLLVQKLPATELFGNLQVLNLDKTGTITTGNLTLLNILNIDTNKLFKI